MIVGHLKEIAEGRLGAAVKSAVVTVPAYFDYTQRAAMKDACHIAGINVLRILWASSSAAMAYALQVEMEGDDADKKEKNVLSFDIGGSGVEACVAVIENGIAEVISLVANPYPGGEDFDDNMILYFAKEFKRKHRKDLTLDARALSRLRAACERAKIELSSAPQTAISIDNLHGGIDFQSSFSRAQFEAMNMALFRKAMVPIQEVCVDSSVATHILTLTQNIQSIRLKRKPKRNNGHFSL